PVDKLGFSRTPAEQADLDRSLKGEAALVEVIRTFPDTAASIRKNLDSMLDDGRMALEALAKDLDSIPSKDAVGSVIRALGNAARQDLAAKLAPLSTIADQFNHAQELAISLVQRIQKGTTGLGLNEVITTVAQVDTLQKVVRELVGTLGSPQFTDAFKAAALD